MAIIRRNDRGGQATRQEVDPFRLMEQVLGWDPFRSADPFRQMSAYAREERGFVPHFDVKETKDGYFFKADLPGVRDEDLDIQLTGNLLTVSGKREAEQHEEGSTWYATERSYGTFTRSFTLPEAADADHVKAEMKDGVLTLVLPKRPELQPKKISVGKSAPQNTKS